MSGEPGPDRAAIECPVCGDDLAPALAVVCARCNTPHHKDCFQFAGTCAVFGCGTDRFEPYRPFVPNNVVRVVEAVLPKPKRRRRARLRQPPARRRPPEPQQPEPPAAPARSIELRGDVVIDVFSTAEWVARAAATAGFLYLSALWAIGPSGGPALQAEPTFWVAVTAFWLGIAVTIGLEDQYVFDGDSRVLRLDRALFGHGWSRVVCRFEDFDHVGTGALAWLGIAWPWGIGMRRVHWLVLVLRNGRQIALGDPGGAVGTGAERAVARMAARVAHATGTRVVQWVRARPSWIANHLFGWFSRLGLWACLVSVLGGLCYEQLLTGPGSYWLQAVLLTGVQFVIFGWLSLAIVGHPVEGGADWDRSAEWVARGPLPPAAAPEEPPARAPQRGATVSKLQFQLTAAAVLATLACTYEMGHHASIVATNLRAVFSFEPVTCMTIDPWKLLGRQGYPRPNFGEGSRTHTWEPAFEWNDAGTTRRMWLYDVSGWAGESAMARQAILASYQPGLKSTCYRDPRRPGYAVLDRSLAWQPIALLAVCLLGVHVAAMLLVVKR
ncbi:MAG: hypothetical protein HY816_08575 [Candidatus Wallbacteria bacterium]|nr:hypothetical protein [Candidatus Wallbacteria bacterium]